MNMSYLVSDIAHCLICIEHVQHFSISHLQD